MTSMRTQIGLVCAAFGLMVVPACSKSTDVRVQTGPDGKGGGSQSKSLSQNPAELAIEEAKCAGKEGKYEVSEYDTSGDGKPDVRKVLLSIGAGVDARRVMICRETDVDSDGRKDVIRYYDDDGRSLREEADRNFDGKMDLAVVFQDG